MGVSRYALTISNQSAVFVFHFYERGHDKQSGTGTRARRNNLTTIVSYMHSCTYILGQDVSMCYVLVQNARLTCPFQTA